MQRLLPDPIGSITPEEAYGVRRPTPAGRPWVLLDMVASLDGATAVDGRSGGLGGPGDKLVFHALRGLADVILVGAGTARAEDYGPPRIPDAVQEHRVLRGQAALPRLAVVSRSLDLPGPRLFEAEPPPIVITAPGAALASRAELAQRADLVLAGLGDDVDLAAALATLREMGYELVVCEGGPRLNGQLLADGLVDELCLTVVPLMVGGSSARAAVGPIAVPTGFELAHLLEHEGELFVRAVRAPA
jgi:riboflavin biosynthesis pyrimidine reductase